MEIDPALLQILLRTWQIISFSIICNQSILETTNLLLSDQGSNDDDHPSHGGSKPGKQPNRPRNFEGSYERLVQHYFCANPLYNEIIF